MADIGAGIKEAEKKFWEYALPVMAGAFVVAIVKGILKK